MIADPGPRPAPDAADGASTAPRAPRRLGLAAALAIGGAGASLFLWLFASSLLAQGPEADELHQAPAAFWHLGRPCTVGCAAELGGVPVLTTSYSGALRPHLYGLVLRARGRFDLADWRWAGVLPTALGIALLPVLLRRRLGAPAAALLVALLATDAGLGVLSRFDFGPVTLAFLLRVLLSAVLVGAVVRSGGALPGTRAAALVGFGLGFVVGLSIYEKLSNLALVPVFALGAWALGALRPRLFAVAGCLVGVAPLVAVNLSSWLERGALVSLAGLADPYPMPRASLGALVVACLRFGQGDGPAAQVTGLPPSGGSGVLEVAAVAALLLMALGARRLVGSSPPARAAGVFALGAVSVAASLALMPRTTHAWHWILVTPFVPLAAAYAFQAWRESTPRRTVALAGVLLALGVLAAARLPRALEVRRALVEGATTPAWSPEIGTFARWGAGEAPGAIFVVSDWGLAPQLYAHSNGARRFLWDALWDPRPPDFATTLADRWSKRRLYLVRLAAIGPARPERVRELERSIAGDRRWREVPPPARVAGLRAVALRAFDRTDAARGAN